MNPLQARYPEAFEYLRARGVEPSAEFYARVEAARKQAWTMSKLSDLEHIGRIKASLEKAIAEGMSFENWRKENLADLQGLPKSYQETVFRTAVQSSYNAGRWAHFRDHAERRPILRYTAINDSRTRPAHRALHGLMMPVDDPRWQTLAPPGGFNCRCTLMSLSERQAKGLGYTGAPQDIPTWTDKHGVEHTATPDKGWNHSPEHDLTDLLREREQKAGVAPAQYSEPVKEKNPIFETSRSITEEGERLYAQYKDVVDEAMARGAPHEGILEILKREGVEVGAVARITGADENAAQEIAEALKVYPADWVAKSNAAGITIVHNEEGRAFARTYPKMDEELIEGLSKTRIETHQPVKEVVRKGEVSVGDTVTMIVRDTRWGDTVRNGTHVHEFGHRLQHVMPELDELFVRLWQERTKNDKTEKLYKLFPDHGYEKGEKTKKDQFPHPYWGKMYGKKDDPQPREMLTMAFQSLIGGEKARFEELFNDKELFYFVLSVFTRYRA